MIKDDVDDLMSDVNDDFNDFLEENNNEEEMDTHKCGRYCDDAGDCPLTECIHNKKYQEED